MPICALATNNTTNRAVATSSDDQMLFCMKYAMLDAVLNILNILNSNDPELKILTKIHFQNLN